MNPCRTLAVLANLLLVTTFANAAAKNTIQIKVLDAQTHTSIASNNGVPTNCDLSNYDAYCHGSKEAEVTNILLIQEGSALPYLVRCTNDSKWAKCAPLPKDATFDAKKEKHGISVYYLDEKGKLRKVYYSYVAEDSYGNPLPAAIRSGAKPSATVAANSEPSSDSSSSASSTPQEVKCSFSSTPSGADITLDGKYVGSTPSVIDVSAGKHVVAVTMPGFDLWKRDLTVSPGSELTVNAVLQKAQ